MAEHVHRDTALLQRDVAEEWLVAAGVRLVHVHEHDVAMYDSEALDAYPRGPA